ncbi:uncharacterized protein LOC141767407 isoform X2 [Sebastes fasciatus]|uniref:uncharacterized protein LOC141767407 isoform X2 n=1 Tax=Sebastes fasciatus TaxID=394691 RepID=UPI003D9E29F3
MMETEQTAASCHAPSQTSVRTRLSSSTRGAPSDTTSRFHGDGVRYKAKLIGVDPVLDAQGGKMVWDSMMKLKGFEAAARKQGKHKRRVWLKVSSSGLRIVDDWTGADPVLVDIEEVCQIVDEEAPQEPAEAPTQTSSLLQLNDSSAPPAEGEAFEEVFSPRPDSSSGQSNQTVSASSTNELMEVFSVPMEVISVPMEDPLMPSQSSCTSPPAQDQREPPQPMLSASQILSMFPSQPPGGSPYSSPPYSPTAVPWSQQGLLGNQWAAPAAAPWQTMPGGVAAWAPAGIAAPPAGGQILAHGSFPGVMMGGNTPASPTAVNGYPAPLNYAPAGATGPLQPASPTLDHNLLF